MTLFSANRCSPLRNVVRGGYPASTHWNVFNYSTVEFGNLLSFYYCPSYCITLYTTPQAQLLRKTEKSRIGVWAQYSYNSKFPVTSCCCKQRFRLRHAMNSQMYNIHKFIKVRRGVNTASQRDCQTVKQSYTSRPETASNCSFNQEADCSDIKNLNTVSQEKAQGTTSSGTIPEHLHLPPSPPSMWVGGSSVKTFSCVWQTIQMNNDPYIS